MNEVNCMSEVAIRGNGIKLVKAISDTCRYKNKNNVNINLLVLKLWRIQLV